MEFKYGTVRLDHINSEDTRFRITSHCVSSQLLNSIRRLGLLNPPVLIESSDEYRIVCGFNRIAACRQLNATDIPARLLDPKTGLDHCVQIAIADNTTQRNLNLVEQAQSVALLAHCTNNRSQLVAVANFLGLSINAEMASKLSILAGMNDLMKSGVLDGSIALPVAMQLQAMKDDSFSNGAAALLIELDLSLNRQREILDWMVSICRRDNIGGSELLSSDSIQLIMQNKELDRRQKAQYVREYLKKRRYPAIIRHEQRFARTLNHLNLSAGIHLVAPQHFESRIYSLKLEFQSLQELLDKLQECQDLAQSEKLNPLWDDFNA